MNASALGQREKWRRREDYRRMTIQKALDFTQELFDAMPLEKPLEKKYPLESLTPHHASPVASLPQTESDPLPTKPCDAWFDDAEAMPPVTPLFDVFWLKGELTFLFGSAGIGKSILAVQILDAISKGAKVQCFDGPQETMRVCYFDFELSTRQFTIRYCDENGKRHKFSPNFFRAEYNARAAKIPKGMKRQDYILEQIEKKIIEHRLEVVVIDNLTALLKRITESEDALEFMDKLVDIKLRYNISMLVIGHTTKRDLSKPLTEDDMSGSKQLINLCDSAFAVGKSMKESNVRYLKQIKTRNAEYKYGSDNVATFRVVKNGSYLCFEHTGFDDEKEHLRERSEAEINELNEKIIALHQSDPNLSYSQIAKQLNTSKSKVARVIQKYRGVYNAPEPF
jgi:RecA-family ATPase